MNSSSLPTYFFSMSIIIIIMHSKSRERKKKPESYHSPSRSHGKTSKLVDDDDFSCRFLVLFRGSWGEMKDFWSKKIFLSLLLLLPLFLVV